MEEISHNQHVRLYHRARLGAWNVHRAEREKVLERTVVLIRRMLDGDGDSAELLKQLSLEHRRAMRKRAEELHKAMDGNASLEECRNALMYCGADDPDAHWLGAGQRQDRQALTLLLEIHFGLRPPLVCSKSAASWGGPQLHKKWHSCAGILPQAAADESDVLTGREAAELQSGAKRMTWLVSFKRVLCRQRDPVLYSEKSIMDKCSKGEVESQSTVSAMDIVKASKDGFHCPRSVSEYGLSCSPGELMIAQEPCSRLAQSEWHNSSDGPHQTKAASEQSTKRAFKQLFGQGSLLRLLFQVTLSHSLLWLWISMVAAHLVNGDLLSLPYPLIVFCYGILESPGPVSDRHQHTSVNVLGAHTAQSGRWRREATTLLPSG